MLVKSSKARRKKEVRPLPGKECLPNGQIREAWRNDPCLRQAMDRWREVSKMTFDEVLAMDITLDCDPVPKRTAVILRAAEVYREVTGRSPRTVGTDANTGPPSGKNPFIALIGNLFAEEGLKPPSDYAITKMLRKKPTKKAVRKKQ
jgi:hypothetical protein